MVSTKMQSYFLLACWEAVKRKEKCVGMCVSQLSLKRTDRKEWIEAQRAQKTTSNGQEEK